MQTHNYSALVKKQTSLLFKSSVISIEECGEGFYAKAFRVVLSGSPRVIIAKAYKYPGIGEREGRQLKFLAKFAKCRMPEVYAFQPVSEACPFDILFMEFLEGIKAADVVFPDADTRKAFSDKVIDNLKGWHAVSNPDGFGDLEGPFYKKWSDFYGNKVKEWHNTLLKMPARKVFSPYVMKVVEFSAEAVADIFRDAVEKSSLLHTDYNLWNVLIDPATYELTGVIDPSDACWGDPEMDLFHLANCRPELRLLDIYLDGKNPDSGFWTRYCFYRFWDDIKHFLRVEWYEEKRFRAYAEELEKRITEQLRAV
jgi:aminoglycoside phosphotransferase (APT) family kinase protein